MLLTLNWKLVGFNHYFSPIPVSRVTPWIHLTFDSVKVKFYQYKPVYSKQSELAQTSSKCLFYTGTVNVLKFWTVVACQIGLRCLIMVFLVCYSVKDFVYSSPYLKTEKSVRNFRTFTVRLNCHFAMLFNKYVHNGLVMGTESTILTILTGQLPQATTANQLGNNFIQNFHLGRYIVGYTDGNLVICWHASGAVKCNFWTYIRRYTSPNENFEYGYSHSNALLQFCLKLECCRPHYAAHHLMKCDVINDVKLFPKAYHRIYCNKFLTLSNQK